MQLLFILTFWIFTLYRYRVCSSQSLLFRNQTLVKENVLENFFADFKDDFLDFYDPRSVTVVGGSRDDLRQTQPLLDRYPFIICEESVKCGYSEKFSHGNFVVIFFEDLSDATKRKISEISSNCRTCTILFVFKGIGNLNLNDVWFVFKTANDHNVAHFEFANLGKNFVELYSDFIATNCSIEVRLATVWRPGTSLDDISTWAFQPRGMNGCPVSVSSLTFTPTMMIEEGKDGSLTIVEGREGELILTLAKELDFTIVLRYPSVADQLKYSRKESILHDVASGISEIGIGRLRPTNNLNDVIEVSLPYDNECITWGVPRIMNWSNDIVWVEFSWEVWLSIGIVFAISCFVGYAYQIHVISKSGACTNPGFLTAFFDTVAIHLGNPVVQVSSSPGGRFMLTSMLFYALVITTAYKTSLASILATDEGTPTIRDAQGIIDANITFGGSLDDYHILQDQVNESKLNSLLLERYVINNNDSANWGQLISGRNYAFLGRRSVMDFERQAFVAAHNSVDFNVLSDCVLAYSTVIAFKRRSFLREPSNKIIQRLTESGILKHWDINQIDAEKILQRRMLEMYYDNRGSSKFLNIFILYFFCTAIALVFFLLELIAHKLHSRNRRSS